MDIRHILTWVNTLTPAQKEDFAARYESKTLTDAEKKELLQHVLGSMRALKRDVDEAKDIMAVLAAKPAAGAQ